MVEKGGRFRKKKDFLGYYSNGWQQVKDAQTEAGVAEAKGEGIGTGIVGSQNNHRLQAGLLLEPLLMPFFLL